MEQSRPLDRAFDPYERWLGIPSSEQPPNHYRLLNIPLFENDSALISNAVLERIQIVRAYQLTEGAVCNKLLNELARARICLLNAERKEEYDTLLRSLFDEARQRTADSERISISPEEIAAVGPLSESQKIKIEKWEVDDVNFNRFLSELHQASAPSPTGQNDDVCNICSYPIIPHSEDKKTCSACGLPFHTECWNEIGGCSAYGCSNVNSVNPIDTVEPTSSPLNTQSKDESYAWIAATVILAIMIGIFAFLLVIE